MIYRELGRTGVKLSRLGFGCMRFPLRDIYDPTSIDETPSIKLLEHAIEQGINYFDNAWPYHREKSEEFTGRALKTFRDTIYLATKLPVWMVKEKSDAEKYFNEQRKRLQTDVIDMYLLHSMAKRSWQKVKDHDILSFLDRIRSEGKIRYVGFSFHDNVGLFKEIIDAYPWDFCQIQLNYVDTEYQAGVEGLEYASSKGLGIVVMEPLRGGKLSRQLPEGVQQLINKIDPEPTPTEFSLKFLFNRTEINCVLSGMSSMEQLIENIKIASNDHVNTLSQNDLQIYKEARRIYQSRTKINC